MATAKKKAAKKKARVATGVISDRDLQDLTATKPEDDVPVGGNPPGRPTDYREEFVDEAYKQCLLGATDEELAAYFGCAVSTVYVWKNEYPEFSEAIRRGKSRADADVAHAVYQRAIGYSHPEVKHLVVDKAIEEVHTIKHYPPDATTGMFWLKNRQPKLWKEKIDTTISASEDLAQIIVGMAKDRPPGLE
jgi:hypothetical protein